MPIAYRRAVAADLPLLVKFLLGMAAENALAPPDVRKIVPSVQEVVQDGFAVLALDGEQIVGSLGAMAGDFLWYSRQRVTADRWLYVARTHRSYAVFVRLIRMLRDYARLEQAPIITGPVTPADLERKTKLYRRAGFAPVGHLFMEA